MTRDKRKKHVLTSALTPGFLRCLTIFSQSKERFSTYLPFQLQFVECIIIPSRVVALERKIDTKIPFVDSGEQKNPSATLHFLWVGGFGEGNLINWLRKRVTSKKVYKMRRTQRKASKLFFLFTIPIKHHLNENPLLITLKLWSDCDSSRVL